jgi:hypothetical protein
VSVHVGAYVVAAVAIPLFWLAVVRLVDRRYLRRQYAELPTWRLGNQVTDGRRYGKVVMLIKYSTTCQGEAVRVELVPATDGRPPVDVVVPADDTSWRRVR